MGHALALGLMIAALHTHEKQSANAKENYVIMQAQST
jgi:hypothetical protein